MLPPMTFGGGQQRVHHHRVQENDGDDEESMLHINVAGTRFTFRIRQLIAANVGLLSQMAKHPHARQSCVANAYIAGIIF